MKPNEETDRPFFKIDDPEHPAPRDGKPFEAKWKTLPAEDGRHVKWVYGWVIRQQTRQAESWLPCRWPPTHWRPIAPTPTPAPATSEGQTPRTIGPRILSALGKPHSFQRLVEIGTNLERELTAATRRAEEAERERDEWKAQAEHQSAIAKQGLVVVGEAANELNALRSTLRQVQAERDEALKMCKELDAQATKVLEQMKKNS